MHLAARSHERFAHAFAPRKVSQPRFRMARSLQYFGCRWQQWQVTYTRSVDTKRQCDLQDTSVVIRHRAKHTIYPSSRAFPLPLPPFYAHPTHVLDVPVHETRSACHCLARRALDLPQRIEHSLDFLSADRVKKRVRPYLRKGEKRKKKIHQYAWYSQDMSFVGRGVAPIHSRPFVRVYVLEEKGN